jgi:hypothetical protein
MTDNAEVTPTNEREAQFKKYKAVHEWALGILIQRTASPESAIDFVNDTSETGAEQVRLRLADTKFALTTFIKVYAQDDASQKRRSEQTSRKRQGCRAAGSRDQRLLEESEIVKVTSHVGR